MLSMLGTQVILLGDSAVGKSKLVERFLMDDYHPRQVRSGAVMEADVFFSGFPVWFQFVFFRTPGAVTVYRLCL
jgi:hypothetical protein